MMDTMTRIKALQPEFNAEFLAMQNALGGNPLTLLRDSDCLANIAKAGKALRALYDLAEACHGPAEIDDALTEDDEKDPSDDISGGQGNGETETKGGEPEKASRKKKDTGNTDPQ